MSKKRRARKLVKHKNRKEERYKFWYHCKLNPYQFLKLVRTYDPDDPKHQEAKPFPYEKEYIRLVTKAWYENQLLVVAKSRQMLMTWLLDALYTWKAVCHPNEYIFLKSLKLEHAADMSEPISSLLSRMMYILLHLDRRFLAYVWQMDNPVIPNPSAKPPVLVLPNGSTVKPVSQDPKEVRGKTVTGVLSDETAIQPWAAQGYRAVRPTLGRGKYTMLSSPMGKNFFYRIYADKEA